MIDSEALATSLEKQIRVAVDRSMEEYVVKTIQQLTLNPDWVVKIENLINQNFILKFDERLNRVDLNLLIRDNLDAAMDRFRDKLKKDFSTAGITDLAQSTELTIIDGSVVAENQIASRTLMVEQSAEIQGSLVTKDLIVKGSINTDNASWNELTDVTSSKVVDRLTDQWRRDLVREVLDLARTEKIDFNAVTVNGQELVTGDTLSPTIRNTSIEKTGVLQDITVSGHSNFNQTLDVSRKRVGINTDKPEMALSVWDEEVSVIVGKLAQQQAFVGTGRSTNLAMGVNRVPYLEINTDGLTTVKQLRVDRFKVGHSAELPGHSGTRGDILFNSDPKPGSAFAWVCLGGFKWQPLKSM